MALGNNINYTPFEETSFGYGVGEIAAAHSAEFPNATDIVKVTLTLNAVQPNYWDPTTGHISTPSVGTAISSYNKQRNEWLVRGQRDDVDAVLAELLFFPSDYAPVRTWTPTRSLPNVTSGAYPMDEPSYQFPMDQTSWFLTVFDASNVYVAGYNVVFYPIDPVYNNQRPWWHTEPTLEDLSSTEYDNQAGGLVDFGIISHGFDTENVTVLAEIRDLLNNVSNAYGAVTPSDDMYVNDKIPASYNHQTGFTFTGSVEETQTFLDTIRYNRIANTNKNAFQFVMSLDDGVIKSYLTKYVYFSDKQPIVTTFPNQSTTEETPLYIDTTGFSLTNPAQFPNIEAPTWRAILTFDATGQSGIQDTSEPMTNGVITITNNSFAEVVNDLSFLQIDFNPDFKDEFTFTLDIEAEGSNELNNHIWSATQQTINVTIADVPEYAYPNVPPTDPAYAISWEEDTFVDFDTGFVITDQAYGGTAQYQYQGFAEYYDGSQSQPLTTATWTTTSTAGATVSGSGTTTDPLLITGSRSQVNDALANMRMIPDLDWTTSPGPNGNFYLTHATITRVEDSVVIAQSGVTGDETGEESELYTYFYAGTAVDSVVIPSTLSYYEDESVVGLDGSSYATLSYINDAFLGVTEETADYHGVTYSLFLYTGANPDIYLGNSPEPLGDYVNDDYVVDGYSANQIAFTQKTAAEMNQILSSLRIHRGPSSFQMNFYVARSGTPGSIFDQDITFNLLPTFDISTSYGLLKALPKEASFYNRIYDEQDYVIGLNIEDTVEYTYSGPQLQSNDLFLAGFGYNNYYDSTLNDIAGGVGGLSPVEGAQSFTRTVHNYEYNANNNFNLVNSTGELSITVDPESGFEDEQSNYDDRPLWRIEKYYIGISNIAASPLIKVLELPRLIPENQPIDISNWTSGEALKTWFAPETYTNSGSINKVVAKIDTSVDIAKFVTGSYPTTTTSNEGPGALTRASDHLFSADITTDAQTGAHYINFYQTDLSIGDDISTTNVGSQLVASTAIGEITAGRVIDVLFDEIGLKFYALAVDNNWWKLYSIDCLSGLTLDYSSGITLEVSSLNNAPSYAYSGAIGRAQDNKVFFALTSYTSIIVYKLNSSNNWTQANWFNNQVPIPNEYDLAGPVYGEFYPDLTSSGAQSYTNGLLSSGSGDWYSKNIHANINGYIAIGNGLYRYVPGTNTFETYNDFFSLNDKFSQMYNPYNYTYDDLHDYGGNENLRVYSLREKRRTALTPNYWVDMTGIIVKLDEVMPLGIVPRIAPRSIMNLYHDDTDTPIGGPNGINTPVDGESQKYHFVGAKHDDVFLSFGNDTYDIITINRLTN